MQKVCLVTVGLFMGLLHACAQTTDTTAYKKKQLSVEEINILTSYYSQDGNNSAVTGGIGTEALKDYSLNAELKLFKYDDQNRKRSWNFNLGVDYYTSASSDKIDPNTISSASRQDLRIYPSAEYVVHNETKKRKLHFELSTSVESDYFSVGAGTGITKISKDKSREFLVKAKCYADQVRIILPYEFRTPATGGLYGYSNEHDYPWSGRTSWSLLFSLSQVINQRLQVQFSAEPAAQSGFLSMPFHRVYDNDDKVLTELLPSSRYKLPLSTRLNYFAGDGVIIRSFYRFYADNWGLNAHSADMETVFKISPFFSISSFYRFHKQNGVRYFAPYRQHVAGEKFYTSNYDLSSFNSHFFGAGIKISPLKKFMGLTQLELRYGHYKRSNRLHADVLSLLVKLK